MEKFTDEKIKLIKDLRSGGHTLAEIKKIVSAGKGTIFKYMRNVQIKEEFKEAFSLKRFGSKNLSKIGWREAEIKAKKRLLPFEKQNSLIVLASLYWGEGNKEN